ncbi:hypothetical protein [Frankia sp. KB5]|uniref:hypothetical protein n=1 Tax=Frankia sp. KB5 TaxID=683318 RepID=UPI0012FFC008|nr:hypothetical protein [Frankia sp. KB5]
MRDVAIPLAVQRRMHAAAGVQAADTHTLDTAHSPFATATAALADIVAAEAGRLAHPVG